MLCFTRILNVMVRFFTSQDGEGKYLHKARARTQRKRSEIDIIEATAKKEKWNTMQQKHLHTKLARAKRDFCRATMQENLLLLKHYQDGGRSKSKIVAQAAKVGACGFEIARQSFLAIEALELQSVHTLELEEYCSLLDFVAKDAIKWRAQDIEENGGNTALEKRSELCSLALKVIQWRALNRADDLEALADLAIETSSCVCSVGDSMQIEQFLVIVKQCLNQIQGIEGEREKSREKNERGKEKERKREKERERERKR